MKFLWTMDELKQIVTNLTQYVVDRHCYSPSQNLSRMPVMMTCLKTPINSAATVQPKTNLSFMGLPPSADRLTKSAPSKYETSNYESHGGRLEIKKIRNFLHLNKIAKLLH